ncbi:MAG: ABC-F family ATP-binding cassette domain-containing protein [bacterium]|nr:ABC-F family ATP-binding cassette domain-containing protein [bacterium]
MLTVSNITKTFPGMDSPILKNISFTVNAGERVGLIGSNGSGKSTLLSVILGQNQADSGGVVFTPPDVRIGYLAQGLEADETTLVRDVLFPNADAIEAAQMEVDRLAALLDFDTSEATLTAYTDALDHLAALGYAVDEAEGLRVLARLGLEGVGLETPLTSLSGGQKTRLNLASILLGAPQLLIMDEPTNHLDIDALEWLEAWLTDFPGAALIVSHDREFLDRAVNRIVALDPRTATARVFVGNYSEYLMTLASERQKQWSAWKDQEVEISRIKTDIQQTMAKATRKENATKDSTQRRYAKKVAKRAKAKEKRLERYLESEDRVEKPVAGWNVKMEFGDLAHVKGEVVRLDNLCIGYDRAAPLLANLSLSVTAGERIAIMGPNGHGKSTLLRTLIGEHPPLAGQVRLSASARIGYLAQQQEILDPRANAMTTIQRDAAHYGRALNETEARSFLHFFLFAGDDSVRPIAQLSYGERSRLMLARLVARGANVLVLDEPTNHLDLPSREKFEQALANYPGTIIAASHDRYFVEQIARKVWYVEDGELMVELLDGTFV